MSLVTAAVNSSSRPSGLHRDRPAHEAALVHEARTGVFWNYQICFVPRQRLTDINTRDAGGMSALYRAVIKGDCCEILHLVFQGASVNLPDREGVSPLLRAVYRDSENVVSCLVGCAADALQPDNCGITPLSAALLIKKTSSIRMVAAMSKGNSQAYLVAKEINARKAVAHLTNCQGLSPLVWRDQLAPFAYVQLKGNVGGTYAWRKIVKGIHNFELHFPGVIPLRTKEILLEAISIASTYEERVPSAIFQRWKTGLPVVLNVGYSGHVSAALLWKNRLILCDRIRGGGPSRKKYFIYKLKSRTMRLDLLERITSLFARENREYSSFWFEELPHWCEKNGAFENLLERTLNDYMTYQSVGNCSWANPEALFLLFFILCEVSSTSELMSRKDELFAIYENWDHLLQNDILMKYLWKRISNPSSFLPDFRLLGNAMNHSAPPNKAHPEIRMVTRQMEMIYGRYLARELQPRFIKRE